MKRWQKAALILIAVIALAFPAFFLPLLPYQYTGSCIEQGGETLCGPNHASISFYLFGSGYLSGLHGSSTYYSWCTNLGFANQPGGYSCPHWFQVPW
jgi:hypothetical protein